MDYNRIKNVSSICKVKIYFSGDFPLLTLSDGPQNDKRFYKSTVAGQENSKDIYHSKSSFRFSEKSKETTAGVVYNQQIVFRFPSNDDFRAQRIHSFHFVKFVEMMLTDGTSLIFGRNDISQNTKIKTETSSDQNLTEVKMSSESIQPVLKKFFSGAGVHITYDFTYDDFVLT